MENGNAMRSLGGLRCPVDVVVLRLQVTLAEMLDRLAVMSWNQDVVIAQRRMKKLVNWLRQPNA